MLFFQYVPDGGEFGKNHGPGIWSNIFARGYPIQTLARGSRCGKELNGALSALEKEKKKSDVRVVNKKT